MKKIFTAVGISTILGVCVLMTVGSTTTVLAKLNCNSEFTRCTGGSGSQGGGAGGNFAIDVDESTYTESGGGGGNRPGTEPGGSGGHTVCDSEGTCEDHGGGSD